MTQSLNKIVDEARQDALQQRERLAAQLETTRERLQPVTLLNDAKSAVKEQVAQVGRDTVAHAKAHPVATGLGILGIVAWVARKPLLAHAPGAVRNGYNWLSGKLRFSEDALSSDEVDGLVDSEDKPPNPED